MGAILIHQSKIILFPYSAKSSKKNISKTKFPKNNNFTFFCKNAKTSYYLTTIPLKPPLRNHYTSSKIPKTILLPSYYLTTFCRKVVRTKTILQLLTPLIKYTISKGSKDKSRFRVNIIFFIKNAFVTYKSISLICFQLY